MALVLKLSVLEKTHIWKPFNVLMPLNDAFLFQNKENKILFGPPPPPPPKKAQGYEQSRYGSNHMCLLIPAACDLEFY